MHRSLAPLLLTAWLPLQALAGPLQAADCRAWRERRNQRAAEAMQAEIALVQATRRRLCPQLEMKAERAHAQASASEAAAGPLEPADFDYSAYLECRRQAEERLRHSRAILYTNQRRFTFYTLEGARLAREADGWQQRLSASCTPGAGD